VTTAVSELAKTPPSYTLRFWPLLVASTVTLVGYSYSYVLLGPIGLLLINTLLWCTGVFAIGVGRRLLVISISLAVMTFVLQWIAIAAEFPNMLVAVAFHVTAIGLVAFISSYVLIAVMKSSTIRTDTVLGGICVYLLMGVLFALMFSLVEISNAGSFSVASARGPSAMTWIPFHDVPPAEIALGEANLLYFSFTTLTTLGYGDISPVSPAARSLTSLEAVAGQLFMAILIARLVGLLPSGRLPGRQPEGETQASAKSEC
jgi:hypothetical protein